MLSIKQEQFQGMVINRRELLFSDIENHLNQFRPDLQAIYPKSYFRWVVEDSIDLATPFHIDDVYSLRLFVRLRWEIAPGFFKQLQIANVLSQTGRKAKDRFEELTTERYAEAWEDARRFDGPREWRSRYWRMDE